VCKLVDGSSGSCCPELPKKSIKVINLLSEQLIDSSISTLAQYIRMIPDERERIIEAGSTLTLTCVYAFENENQRNTFNFSWKIPDYLTENIEAQIFIFNRSAHFHQNIFSHLIQ